MSDFGGYNIFLDMLDWVPHTWPNWVSDGRDRRTHIFIFW